MNTLESIQAPVQADLQEFRRQFSDTLQSDNPLLHAALDHILNRCGKMVRPTMVMLAARSVGEVNQRVMDVALALELLHTASLLHDDVVDESDERRGQSSVNAMMTNQIAVLVGDYILSRSLHHAALTGSPEIVSAVAMLGQTLADGELQQLANLDSQDIDEVSYYSVVRKKTSSLFAACAQLGVMAAGGSTEQSERMRQLGSLVGTCFQLRDDLLDFCGSERLGKPAGNDMREGKLTLPAIYAINTHGDEEIHAVAKRIKQGTATTDDITRMVAFTKENGGIDYARKVMDDFHEKALEDLRCFSNEEVAEALKTYLDYVIGRDL